MTILEPIFNVTDFGAVEGKDSTDAFQKAVVRAVAENGKVIVPATRYGFILSDTIHIEPESGSQAVCDIDSSGNFGAVVFTGTGKAAFRSLGWKRSHVSRVKVRLTDDSSVGWDVDANASFPSTSSIKFDSCDVTAPEQVEGFTGWRIGHSSVGHDVSFLTWIGCESAAGSTGNVLPNIGFSIEGSNTLHLSWYNVATSAVDKAYTTVSSAGAGQPQGGSSYFWSDCGGSSVPLIYELKTAGIFRVSGGRWELSGRLLSVPNGGGSNVRTNVLFSSLEMDAFDPPADRLVDVGSAAAVMMDGCHVGFVDGYTPTDDLFTLSSGAGGFGMLDLRGCSFPTSLPDPFYTLGGGTWEIGVKGCALVNAGGEALGRLAPR